MKRIAVVGSGGAGKSTFARQLGQRLNLPVYHLDAFYWKPGWVESPQNEWEALNADLISRDAWVIDGNYGGTMESRFAAADSIVYLDFPRRTCLWRVLKRRLAFSGRTRPDMGKDCPEILSWDFVKWIWNFPAVTRPVVLERIDRLGKGKRVAILRTLTETQKFLDDAKDFPPGGTPNSSSSSR